MYFPGLIWVDYETCWVSLLLLLSETVYITKLISLRLGKLVKPSVYKTFGYPNSWIVVGIFRFSSFYE